jgi:hypothetical protein
MHSQTIALVNLVVKIGVQSAFVTLLDFLIRDLSIRSSAFVLLWN